MKLRAAEGSEIDWLNAEWHIPAIRMKMPVNLIVPPSRQTVAILRQIQPLTGQGRYVFRASACTMPNEMGKHPDWIERQLAHGGARRHAGSVQLCGAFTAAEGHDAAVGGLSGQAQAIKEHAGLNVEQLPLDLA